MCVVVTTLTIEHPATPSPKHVTVKVGTPGDSFIHSELPPQDCLNANQ